MVSAIHKIVNPYITLINMKTWHYMVQTSNINNKWRSLDMIKTQYVTAVHRQVFSNLHNY